MNGCQVGFRYDSFGGRDANGKVTAATGAILLEMLISCLVLGTLLTVVLPTIQLVRLQLRQADRRMLAMSEADNVIKELDALSIDEIKNLDPKKTRLSVSALEQLPGAELEISVRKSTDDLSGHQIVILISFTDDWGQQVEPVRLVNWRFESEGSL